MFKNPLAKAYPAIFTPEPNGGYFIEFPDIQGAYTGINENDIAYGMEMAEEVLGLVLADYIEHGDSLPKATPVDQVKHDEQSFVTLIRVDIEKYFKDVTMVKKTLTIPKWADDLGARAGINFSRILTNSIADIANDIHPMEKQSTKQ
ncbi:HicB family protein [Enterococcus faecalis]|uniref:type II toxin-antitoxin system HicB family antitoxin n=1 Tax=Enterococcus faecalis TaxID=1351 RepID=UPI0013643D87|nr:type II toxin-antitoxin system HicB family antitoxin [Enterococcus faecalis]NBJ47238.1 HicB family protein [Enterococcus faecalis]